MSLQHIHTQCSNNWGVRSRENFSDHKLTSKIFPPTHICYFATNALLLRVFAISLQLQKNAKIVTNLEFATKYATKKNKHLLLKNVPKLRQILNLRQISVCSNKIFSPLDHGTYSFVVWILHSCTRSSFLSFWIHHTEGINISDFCLCLFTDLNQHDIEFITASDNTIPIWISLCANPAHHPKCILDFRGEDEERWVGDYWDHHYCH